MAKPVSDFYDQLAASYHLIFEDWDASIMRQANALRPILESERGPAARILDCACGIGTQALGLASLAFKVTASDVSPFAIERAREEAEKRGLKIPMFVADMADLSPIPGSDFDAIVCLDNALPHLESDEDMLAACGQIRAKLRTGGALMASIRDYDKLIRERPLVQGPAFYSDGGKRRIVHQIWDWIDQRRYVFHLYITRETQDGWEAQHYVSSYRAILRDELSEILKRAGFIDIRWFLPDESGFYQPIVITRR